MTINEIILKRKITGIKIYRVKLNIKIKKPAEIFQVITKLVDEKGKINKNILMKEFGFSNPMAENALNRCLYLNIIKVNSSNPESYVLTDVGSQVLMDGSIFRSEEKHYRIYLVNDPLIPQRVLTVQRIHDYKSSKSLIIQNLKIDDIKIQNLVIGLDDYEKEGFINSDEIIIEKCYDRLENERYIKCELEITCNMTPDKTDVILSGTVDTQRIKTTLKTIPEEFNFNHVFKQLMSSKNLLKDWDAEIDALNVSFSKVSAKNTNYSNFTKKIDFKKPEIENFSYFDNTKMNLTIVPRSDEDCLEWEKHLLRKKINDLCSENDFNNFRKKVVQIMDSKSGRSIILPSHIEFINELLEDSLLTKENGISKYGPRSKKYWFLRVPMDLPL